MTSPHKTVRVVRKHHSSPGHEHGALDEYRKRTAGMARPSRSTRPTSGLWSRLAILALLAVTGLVVAGALLRHARLEARRRAFALRKISSRATRTFETLQTVGNDALHLAPRLDDLLIACRRDEQVVLAASPSSPRRAPSPAPAASSPEATQPPASAPASGSSSDHAEDTPPGIMSAEEIWGRKSGRAAASKPAPAPARAASPSPPAPRPPPAARPASEVEQHAVSFSNVLANVHDILTEARHARDRAAHAATPELAAKHLGRLREDLTRMRDAARQASNALARAHGACLEVTAMRTALEQKQAEQQRQVEAQRQAAARAARESKEMASVAALRSELTPMATRHDYAMAARACRDLADASRTDAALAALETLETRYRRLQRLKRFIIRTLNAQPFSWGWGQGADARDVLGATEEDIMLKRASVPWADVGPRQMLRFIDYALQHGQASPSKRAEHTLAAAIFCKQHGGDKAAERYARRAVELAPSLQQAGRDVLEQE